MQGICYLRNLLNFSAYQLLFYKAKSLTGEEEGAGNRIGLLTPKVEFLGKASPLGISGDYCPPVFPVPNQAVPAYSLLGLTQPVNSNRAEKG